VLRIALPLAVFALVALGYVLWRRPPRRLGDRRLDLGDLGVAGPAILQFTTAYCAPCRATAPHLLRAAEEGRVNFAQVDVGLRPDVARSYGIRTVPTIAVADHDGKIFGVWTALPEGDELVRAVALARG
jgi:thiol-disulfide isomerase/thioredoxin